LEFILPNRYGLEDLKDHPVGLHLFVLRGTERFAFEAEVEFFHPRGDGVYLYLRVVKAH
jgi:hypothetical protein